MEQRLHNSITFDKDTLIFVAKLLFFYLLFSEGNLLMNSVMNEGGKFYNATIANNFNYIQALKTALIVPAVWIINLFGYTTFHNQMDVLIIGGSHLRVNYSCLGLGVMSFVTAFVIAIPAKLKPKIQLLIFGLILIYFLNMARIAGLSLLMSHFKSQRGNFTYHHEIFNTLVYIIIFLLLYLWIKKNAFPIQKLKIDHKLE